jgi:hypothetical protein
MTKRRNDEVVDLFALPLDETVHSILSEETRRRDEMQLSPDERKRIIEQRRKDTARKQAAKAKAQGQNKVTLVLPPKLVEKIEITARWQSVTTSQIVTFFLFEAMAQYEQGAIHFDGCKHPSYNPRYDYELIHPQDAERQERRSTKKKRNGWG